MRMPHYGVASGKNNWTVTFFCEECAKPFGSNSQAVQSAAKRDAFRRFTSKIPLVGSKAERDEDESAEIAWQELQPQFRECEYCNRVVGLECWDDPAGKCRECSGLKHQQEQANAVATGRPGQRR